MKQAFVENPADLSELKILKPDDLKRYVDTVEAIPDSDTRKLILAIGTGGTISTKETPEGKVPDLDFAGIFDRTAPSLNEKFCVQGFDAYRIDSSQMKIDHVHDLAIAMAYIRESITKKALGFLVLHGTDTMAEASSRMAMMQGQGLNYSIVYTGAQKSVQQPINDAVDNIVHSLYTLESMHDNGCADVAIVMGDGVLQATGARKVSDTSRNAFDTPMHELLSDLSILQYPVPLASWTRKKDQVRHVLPNVFGGYTQLLDVHSKMSQDPRMIRNQVRDKLVQGVLLTTYGAGTSDLEVAQCIIDSKRKDLPLFMVSPVNSDPSLGGYQPGEKLIEMGFQPLFMTPEAARAKFDLAVKMFNGNVNNIVNFMLGNYIGEVPNSTTRRRTPLLRH